MEKAEESFNFAIERWQKLLDEKDALETFANKNNPIVTLAPPNWFNYL